MPNSAEKIASKAMGAMKTVKATAEGLTGVFKHLATEHGEVTALLLRVKTSSDVEVRKELFPEIRSELVSHEKAELREVYPAFEKHVELEAMAKDHEKEAGDLEQLIEELHAMPFDDAGWETKFAELADLVADHAREEEDEYFPVAQGILGKEEADRLLQRFERAKAKVKERVAAE
jgi:Hemerythrin HHE cation binding domain